MSSPKPTGSKFEVAVVCPPGLEELCRDELKGLGIKSKVAGPGLLEFNGNARQLYTVNVWSRIAGRVMVRVAIFRATDFQHLQEHAMRIAWDRWVPSGFAPKFRISTNASRLYHTKAIAQRLHQVSLPPSLGEPEQLFVVRIERNTVTISADSSGQALHQRPWRTDVGSAPLRPTMASGLLQAVGWGGAFPLVDPFCGSGTIGIEAALSALGLPPGGEREFAFHHWPGFEPGSWASVAGTVAAAQQAADGIDLPPIELSDRDASAVSAAEANAERAEVANRLTIERRVIAHLPGRSGDGLVATNPPYGKRMGSGADRARLNGLYKRLGAVARERLPGYGLAVVTSDPSLAKRADGGVNRVAGILHGGLRVGFYHRPAGLEEDTEQGVEQGSEQDTEGGPDLDGSADEGVDTNVQGEDQPATTESTS